VPVSPHLLNESPFFKSLPEKDLIRLSQQMTLRSFSRREMVIAKDQTRHELGFLIEGRLQGVDFTVDGRNVGLYFVEPGDFFGELSLIDGLGASEYVIAANKSTAAFLNGEAAKDLIFSTPQLAMSVTTRMATRVRAVTAQRTLLALPNPFQRLCVQIMQLPSKGKDGIIDPVPTHQELAIMINASRETVTRAFQLLTLHRALQRDGSALKVVRPDFLKDIAEGRQEPPKA
jgi:CRP-like cAMP-binding protein